MEGGSIKIQSSENNSQQAAAAKCTAIQRPQWLTCPMTFTSLMVSEDGAWLQVALGTQQWTKGSQTHDYKDTLVSGVPSQLPLRQSTRTRKHCSDLSMQVLDQFYSMCWLVLARGSGYPMTVSIWDRRMLWPVSLTKTCIGNLFAVGKQPQLLHRHSQPSTGLRIPLSIRTVIFQFLNTTSCVLCPPHKARSSFYLKLSVYALMVSSCPVRCLPLPQLPAKASLTERHSRENLP